MPLLFARLGLFRRVGWVGTEARCFTIKQQMTLNSIEKEESSQIYNARNPVKHLFGPVVDYPWVACQLYPLALEDCVLAVYVTYLKSSSSEA